jgi:hypothetical protein
MAFVSHTLLVLHFIGLSALLGGFLVQMGQAERATTRGMMHGALTQLVTGIGLVGMAYARGFGDRVDNVKITIKLLIAIAVTVVVIVGRRRGGTPAWAAAGGLTLLNVGVAVYW